MYVLEWQTQPRWLSCDKSWSRNGTPSYSHMLGLHPSESSKPQQQQQQQNNVLFQWEGIWAHFAWDFTDWSVVLFTQQIHDTCTWDTVGKGNEMNCPASPESVLIIRRQQRYDQPDELTCRCGQNGNRKKDSQDKWRMESVKDGHRQQLLSVSNRGSFRKEAVTSLCNRLQMKRHYKAMLMRPARALWDRHPRSANVNLSPNVHVRAWRGMEEAERKKIISICRPPAFERPLRSNKRCSISTWRYPSPLLSTSCTWSLDSLSSSLCTSQTPWMSSQSRDCN